MVSLYLVYCPLVARWPEAIWESVVFHPDDVACPAQLDLQQRSLNTDGFSTLEDLNVGDVVVPLDVEDDAEAALLETFQ